MAKAAKKSSRKKVAAKSSKTAAAPAPRVVQHEQQAEYAKAVEHFNARRFAKAAVHFRKVLDGSDVALRHRAEVHLRICQKQTESAPKLKTADEHYTYAVTLINERELDEAEGHLDAALKQQKSGAHLHYAKAVVAALRGDAGGASERLREAIALDPQNRILARKDADLEAVAADARIRALLDDDGNGA